MNKSSLIFLKKYVIIKYKINQRDKGELLMKTVVQTIWYIDDDNQRHITVVREPAEFAFIKERFDYVGVISNS